MLRRLLAVSRSLALIMALAVAGPVVCVFAIGLMYDWAGLLFPALGTPHRAALTDWIEQRAARDTEERLGAKLMEYGAEPRSVVLTDLVRQPMRRACVDTGSWAWPNSARDLAVRSERSAWWLPWAGHATLAIEFADGRVMAYRLPTALANWAPTLRLRFPANARAACARDGRLVFAPQSAQRYLWSVTYDFMVRGD